MSIPSNPNLELPIPNIEQVSTSTSKSVLEKLYKNAQVIEYPDAIVQPSVTFGNHPESDNIRYFLKHCDLHFLQHPAAFTRASARFLYVYKSLRGRACEWLDGELEKGELDSQLPENITN